jgi:hypothetical protein
MERKICNQRKKENSIRKKNSKKLKIHNQAIIKQLKSHSNQYSKRI